MEIKRVGLSEKDLALYGSELRKAGIYHIAGSSTLYVPSVQTKFINVTVAKEWPDKHGEVLLMTPGEAARAELQRVYPDLKRVGWHRSQVRLFDWRSPMYCKSTGKGQYSQIDLTSAYHQIYRWLWLNTPFPLGYGSLPLSDVADRLHGWKEARNALVGVTRSRVATAYKDGKRIDLKTRNAFLSPGLWATLQATLNQIASVAVMFGAVYINTDGYTFERESVGLSGFKQWLENEGLIYRTVRDGFGDIAGWNCYKVGKYETHLYRTGARTYGQLSAITQVNHDFTGYIKKCRQRYSSAGVIPESVPQQREAGTFDDRTGRPGDSPHKADRKIYVGRQEPLFGYSDGDLPGPGSDGAFGSD